LRRVRIVRGVSRDHILEQLIERHRARAAEFELDGAGGLSWLFDELANVWRGAQADATDAYEHWCATPGTAAFAVYRAAQDRADQAQDALAGRAARERGRPRT
jgi:hypothetical protein